MEARSKRKHDANTGDNSDVPISEWVKKPQQEESVEVEKKKKAEKRGKKNSKGVDPLTKKQKVEKKKPVKKEKKSEAPDNSNSESEGAVLPRLSGELIEGRK
ncbi:hypothetical protein Dimus_022208, partial [Dionaea muscipula]